VRYAISHGAFGLVVGQSTYTWDHDGHAYKLQSVTETTGLIALIKAVRVVQTSRGEITAKGLRPHEFRNERVGGTDSALFDWTRRVVSYAGREEHIAADTQDPLSMLCQLALQAEQVDTLEMPIATGRKLESYRIEVIGEERIELPNGGHRAMHLKTTNGSDMIEAWVSKELPGLPLKIRFVDRKGEIFDQIAQDIDITGAQ
jgi:hypothetical protein